MSKYDEQLARELQQRAAGIDGSPISLDDVKRSAGRIRWQRRAAGGVVAAAVLAIAVPVGINVADRPGTTPSPAGPSPSPTPSGTVDQANEPIEIDPSALGLGDAAGVDHLEGQVLVTGDGDRVDVPADVVGLVPLGEGYLFIRQDERGERLVTATNLGGTYEVAIGDRVAVSADGSVAAFSSPDGQLLVTWAEAEEPVVLADAGGQVAVYAVAGSGPCVADAPVEQGGCAVYFAVQSNDPQLQVADAQGVRDVPGYLAVADVAGDGRTSGTVEVDELVPSSTSAVRDAEGGELWRTSNHTLETFSPDARHLLAGDSYRDGFGERSLAVYDAESGEPLQEFETDTREGRFVMDYVWETEETFLVVVYGPEGWSLVRGDLDGDLELAGEPVPADEFDAAYRLPTR